MSFSGLGDSNFHAESEAPSQTSGRQVEEVNCSGYTFEDMFDYNHAKFDVQIMDDWASANFYANTWVNETKASNVRENMDGLFAGMNGGNNSWLSTDERNGLIALGPSCIADMETRMGLAQGEPHRGQEDWNDWQFVEDGIGLGEVNLVPQNHAEERDCQNILASAGCKEIPVSVTDNLEISMYLQENENYNLRFDQLSNKGASNFTFALNATNISSADLAYTFPVQQGLRIAGYAMMDDGVENLEFQEPFSEYLADGRLRVHFEVDYQSSDYPTNREVFIDFTTAEPESNNPPQWTDSAPENGTIIPVVQGQDFKAVLGEQVKTWVSDDTGWSIKCEFTQNDFSMSMNEFADILISSSSIKSEATCFAQDPFQAVTDNRTWTFAELFTSTASIDSEGENIEFSITPTSAVSSFEISAHAHQMNKMATGSSATITDSPTTMLLTLEGMKPGMVKVMGMASGEGLLPFNFINDYGLEKESIAPVIEIDENLDGTFATWDASGLTFTVVGTVYDLDGEDVSLSYNLCGVDASDFTRSGNNWEVDVSTAICAQQGINTYDITFSAKDESGKINSISINIPDPFASDGTSQGSTPSNNEEESEGLPAISLIATVGTILLGFAIRQRNENL